MFYRTTIFLFVLYVAVSKIKNYPLFESLEIFGEIVVHTDASNDTGCTKKSWLNLYHVLTNSKVGKKV